MDISTLTSKGQTTVPKEVREVLGVKVGDKLWWKICGAHVEVSTKRPLFFELKGSIKTGPGNVIKDIEEARKRRGRY